MDTNPPYYKGDDLPVEHVTWWDAIKYCNTKSKKLSEYINYYNTMRLHQGIDKNIPQKYELLKKGKIVKLPILSGLYHHYHRKVA